MKYPRITGHCLLIAALILGVVLAAEKMRRVSRYRRERSAELLAEADVWARDALSTARLLDEPGGADEAEKQIRWIEIRNAIQAYQDMSQHCRRLARDWEQGAYEPWLPIPPDPLPPEPTQPVK